jgi:pyruvate-formate lyase-activating enzyme
MENEYLWKVVPLSKGQLLDVRPEDIILNGIFRKCNTYRGGGGYDLFPYLANRFFNEPDHNLQFIVQLFGCNLDCPYCYVTRAGVWGNPIKFTSRELVGHFNDSPCTVFHLMGGAPALKLPQWPQILTALDAFGKPGWVFHSDLMLTELEYSETVLNSIAHSRSLYAVNIKGFLPETFEKNTRKSLDNDRFTRNITALEASNVKHYFTFTNVPEDEIRGFWYFFELSFGRAKMKKAKELSSTIDLKSYLAEAHVDETPWGRNEILPPS